MVYLVDCGLNTDVHESFQCSFLLLAWRIGYSSFKGDIL